MSTTMTGRPAASPGRRVTIRRRAYRLQGPSIRDPRLHVTATIMSLHVLGQVALGFELSIAQILVCLITCATLEVLITGWEKGLIAWPASALLTGNGVAFVLRVNGTEHGDWWSLNGWYIFAATAALGLLSKYAIKVGQRLVFNPSNVALVLCFVLLGTDVVNPLDFWWGPWSLEMALVYAVLAAGAVWVTMPLGLLPLAAGFWGTFAAGLALLAASGHCLTARWSVTPVCGADFWWIVTLSPEVLVFMLFMITDPKSIPRTARNRVLFGVTVGVSAAVLVAPASTEFWAKVGVLASLVVVHVARAVVAQRPSLVAPLWTRPRRSAALGTLAFLGIVALAGLPARTPAPVEDVVDRGVLAGRPNPEFGALPPVSISDGVSSILGGLSQTEGERIGRDLIQGLMIEENALAEGDEALLATAVSGDRLENDLEGRGAPSDVSRIESLTVVVVRDPTNPQAIPRVGLRARGAGTDSVFALVDVGGTYLITEEMPWGDVRTQA